MNSIWKCGIPVQLKIQFHMIIHLDDTIMALKFNLQPYPHFGFVLKTRLSWEKNVLEEQDALWQIVMKASDSHYCVHFSLGILIECLYTEFAHCDDFS